jgi:hypothetical protein
MQCGTVFGSGKFRFPVLWVGIFGIGQDRPGYGFCSLGRRFGVGIVGDSVRLSGGGKHGAGKGKREELLVACTQAQRPADMDRIVREAESSAMMEPDPEAWYHVGALMAYCGQKEAALRLLKAAVQQNYCAYSALLEDPLLKDLRKDTAFNQVLTAGSACQEALKQGRGQ